VVFAYENLYTWSHDALVTTKEKIVENELNRVVVASCRRLTAESAETAERIWEVGLNPYLFEMCSLREQCSWVHMNQSEED